MPRVSASNSALKHRCGLKKAVRHFFEKREYYEVDPSGLRTTYCLDPFIDVFSCSSELSSLFLQSSPELAMKHLLCEYQAPIYYLGPAWRRGEEGSRHAKEFTMIEWYRPDAIPFDLKIEAPAIEAPLTDHLPLKSPSYIALMQETCELCLLALAFPHSPKKTTPLIWALPKLLIHLYSIDIYSASSDEVFACICQTLTSHSSEHDLPKQLSKCPLNRAQELNWVFGLLMCECIEPWLSSEYPDQMVILHEFLGFYPDKADCALAQASTLKSQVHIVERFELYYNGVELANGYKELTCGEEMQRRQQEAGRIKELSEEGQSAQIDWSLIDKMKRGLFPESCGVAVGFDRLLMINWQKHHPNTSTAISSIRVDR